MVKFFVPPGGAVVGHVVVVVGEQLLAFPDHPNSEANVLQGEQVTLEFMSLLELSLQLITSSLFLQHPRGYTKNGIDLLLQPYLSKLSCSSSIPCIHFNKSAYRNT